jgi:hypothetical protein
MTFRYRVSSDEGRHSIEVEKLTYARGEARQRLSAGKSSAIIRITDGLLVAVYGKLQNGAISELERGRDAFGMFEGQALAMLPKLIDRPLSLDEAPMGAWLDVQPGPRSRVSALAERAAA